MQQKSHSLLRYAAAIGLATLTVVGIATVGPLGRVRASQTETQFASVDATTCIQISGGTLTRDNDSVQSSSTSAWTIRCQIDVIDSSTGSATINAFQANAKATSDLTTHVTATVYRRSITADAARSSVTTCNIPANMGVPTSCSSTPSHAVDDNTTDYYIELSVPSGEGAVWELSGARVSYSWVNGP